jgi:hypothetical protein
MSPTPADVWREMCWRYVVYPASYQGSPADVVFAVFLQPRRPAIHAVLVDASTGKTLAWPVALVSDGRFRPGVARVATRLTTGVATGPATPVPIDLSVSTDV